MTNCEVYPSLFDPDFLFLVLSPQLGNLGSVFLASDPASVPAVAIVTVTHPCCKPTMCQALRLPQRTTSHRKQSSPTQGTIEFWGRNLQNYSLHETGPSCWSPVGLAHDDLSLKTSLGWNDDSCKECHWSLSTQDTECLWGCRLWPPGNAWWHRATRDMPKDRRQVLPSLKLHPRSTQSNSPEITGPPSNQRTRWRARGNRKPS